MTIPGDARTESGSSLLSGARLDALREVANIGAGHAATALSTLTGTRIMISVPMVNIVPPGDFVPEIAADDEIVAVQMTLTTDGIPPCDPRRTSPC